MMRAMQTGGRRIMLAAGLAMACLLPAGVAGAQEEGQPPPPVPARIGAKFVRGMTNLTTGFGEFPKQIYLIGRKEGWVQGTFRGPVEGLGMFIARTVAGAYEVVTFLIPVPSGYQPMLLPEYVWQPEPTSQVTMPAAEPAAPMLAPDNR
jgi:putative exosortase-associated protein (TIGR04073 family)